jgi:poly(hydroxyalkanoate) depolymerase family esterase
MYLYVPVNVRPNPALLVGAHWCTGTAQAFYSGTEFRSLADQYGFIVVYPSVTRSSRCFDVASPQTLARDGGSDSTGIKSMVDHVLANYGADADRVYATGVSSGAMMTNVLLGVYPDVFAGGSAFSGVPYTCFATTNGSEWNSECSNGQIIRTPQQWGDAVRDANPGYGGPWPRMQLWHGTEDDALRYPNFGEMIKQWTNVHGLSQTPSFSDQPQANWNRTRYGGTGTHAPVEAISLQGVGHNLMANGMAVRAIQFFGLDQEGPAPTDPTTSPTAGPTDPTTSPTTGPTTPPPGGCSAVIEVANDWGSGWQGSVSVTAGADAINGWQLTWTWPGGQGISSHWNADVSTSGATVTASDVGWNGRVGAGQTVNAWGFIGTGASAAPQVTCTPA